MTPVRVTRLEGKRPLVTGASPGYRRGRRPPPVRRGRGGGGQYRSGRDAAEALAKELSADGGQAVALRDAPDLPDGVHTMWSALGRFAEPEEVAAAIAFLASPDASYITGSTLAVDGTYM